MPTVNLPLPTLAQRVAQKQSELEQLHRQYERRLAGLKHRKEELTNQLRQIETEIRAAAHKGDQPTAPETKLRSPSKSVADRKITLAGLIVKLLQKAGQPLTVKQLTEEIQRLKVPTKSANISGMIKARVFELIRKGLLAR